MNTRIGTLYASLPERLRPGNAALIVATSVAVRIAGTGLAFLVAVLLARLMGPDGYGTYSFAIAVVTLLTVLSQLGLPTLIVREVSRYSQAQRWGLLRGLLLRSSQTIAAMSLLAVGIVAALILTFRDSSSDVQADTLMWALVLIPLISFNLCGGAALRALGCIVRGQLAEQLLRPGMLLLFIASIVIVTDATSLTPVTGMALHATSGLFAFIIGLIFLLRRLPAELRSSPSSFAEQPQWMRSLLPLSLLAGLQVITSQTDILMLGYFVASEDVGIYRVGWQMASLVNLIMFAIGLSVEPKIARLYQARDLAKLQQIVTRTAHVAFGIALVMSLILILFGGQLLRFVFGPAFDGSYLPMVILCGGQVALAFSGWAVLVLNMTGNERITTQLTAIAAAANLAANAILIPWLGLVGAAIATASTMFVWKLALANAARRKVAIYTMIFFPRRPHRASGDN